MDNAERSYHRALKQLLQLQSGYPDPAQPKPSAPELLPVAPVAAELEPPPNQPPSPGIGFVPSSRVCSSPAFSPALGCDVAQALMPTLGDDTSSETRTRVCATSEGGM
jgi:hypothetical protein